METRLHGREIAVVQGYERPPREMLHLIRKLRWIGMDAEAEQLQQKLREATPTGGVITAPRDTD